MNKKRLFKIMARADASAIAEMAEKITFDNSVTVIKGPGKTLAMIKMREPVKESLFYIGEVIVSEAVVEIGGTKGFAVTVGDEPEKVLNMAIIDAAYNNGVFGDESALLDLEEKQIEREQRENAMFQKTKVNFNTMDGEAPQDVSSFKKA